MERVRLAFPAEAVRHRHPLTVRIGDMNHGRHLGHDALVTLLHEARVAALASLGLREWDMGGYPGVVADLAVQYQGEAHWPDPLTVETAFPPTATGSDKAIVVYQRMCQADGRPVATARLTLLLIDPEAGRPAPVPQAIREALIAQGDD